MNTDRPADVPRPLPVRVVIADDHPLVLIALERVIETLSDGEVAGRAATVAELIDVVAQVLPDAVVTDLGMPDGDVYAGLDAVAALRSRHPGLAIVVLTVCTDAHVLNDALARGADAVISKCDRIELIHVALVAARVRERYLGPRIREALRDGAPRAAAERVRDCLTRREYDVLCLYASGCTVSEIARRAERSVKTISAQKCRAMRKLGLTTDADLYRFAQANGMIAAHGQTSDDER